MTDFINPIVIKDSRIENISDSIGYGVFSGASTSTYQQYPAVSASSSQIIFNCAIPSENTLIDRNILIQATYNIKFTITKVAAGSTAFNYAIGECFQAFPINSSIKNMTATINNNSFSINSQDVLQQLIKLVDPRDFQKYNGMSPTMPDLYFNTYNDAVASVADITGDYRKSGFDNFLVPRGSHPLKSITVDHRTNIGGKDTSLKSTHINDIFYVYLEAEFTEPLFLSPFLFGGKDDFNNQALTGINSFNLVINLDTSLKRFFSTNNTNNITIQFTEANPITNAKLLFNFLTIQETDKIKTRNIVNYIDYPVFISNDETIVNAGNTKTIISNNYQLNQIPDLLIICCRRPLRETTIRHTNSFLPIRNISINFNNSSGLLSSATPQNLWRMSRINGSQQCWNEFWGYAGKANITATNTALTQYLYNTSGSIIIINPSRDLSLPYYLSNGSVGNYNIQFKIDIINNTTENFSPELVLITANSGIMVNDNGNTEIYTGLLTKELVVNANLHKSSIPSASYNRLVGGSVNIEPEIDNSNDKKNDINSKLDKLVK
jgi:hypothetical protein